MSKNVSLSTALVKMSAISSLVGTSLVTISSLRILGPLPLYSGRARHGDDGRELDNPSSRHHVRVRGPSPDRLTTEAAAPQRHVRSTNTIRRNTGSPLQDSQIPL